MNLVAHPSVLSGRLVAPASKSHMQRLVAAALLARGESWIRNPSVAADCIAAVEVAAGLGADIEVGHDAIRMEGGLAPRQQVLPIGESGLGIRLFSPIAALATEQLTLEASGSLKSRPMQPIADALEPLGVTVGLNEGCPPVVLQGPLKGGTLSLDGTLSSQFLTGLLMALPLASEDSTLNVHNLQSRPYVDMTMEVMASAGISMRHQDHQTFEIPGGQSYTHSTRPLQGTGVRAPFC